MSRQIWRLVSLRDVDQLHGFIAAALIAAVLSLSITLYAQGTLPLPPVTTSIRSSTELLTNLSFENDTNADKLPDSWLGKRTKQTHTDQLKCDKPEQDKYFAHSGACAFMFRGNPDGSSSTIQQVVNNTSMIQTAMVWTFSVYIDPQSAITDRVFGTTRLKFSDGTSQKLKLTLPPAIPLNSLSPRSSGDYQLVTVSKLVIFPTGAALTDLKVSFSYDQPNGKFFIDDVSLRVDTPAMTETSTPTIVTTLSATTTATISETNISQTFTPSATPTGSSTVVDTATPTETLTPTLTSTPTPTLNGIKLLAGDPGASDSFGYALAVSTDGNTALVGAYRDAIGGAFDQGSAYVYVRNGNTWTQQAHLIANDGAVYDRFGISVALSANGNMALIGAWGDDVGDNQDQGSAYVFVRDGNTWTQQAKLVAADGAVFTNFGFAVALSAVGDTALVGAPRDNKLSGNQGAAYVFTRSGTAWTQQIKLVASDGSGGDFMGASVSLSASGSAALVGAYGDTVGANTSQGSAHIFTRNNGVWSSGQKLVASDGTQFDLFGNSVALSGDGTTAVVGAYFDTLGTSTPMGSVYIFKRDVNYNWQPATKLTANDGSGADLFGISVSTGTTGNTVLIGAYQETINANANQGAAYVFGYTGTVWTQQRKLVASDGTAGDYFGNRVALPGDVGFAFIGAAGDDIIQNDQGSAYIFDLP